MSLCQFCEAELDIRDVAPHYKEAHPGFYTQFILIAMEHFVTFNDVEDLKDELMLMIEEEINGVFGV